MIVTPFAKRVVLVNCAVPAILLAWDAVQHRLGANPDQARSRPAEGRP